MLPTLYKKTSTGKIQTWRIWVEGNTIYTEYGQLGGKLQQSDDTIKVGKNIGRSNETTPEQQAELEALSQWEKKSKKHYVQNIEDAQSGIVDSEFVAGGIAPMLAHSFAQQGSKITFPAYVQPKLDGHRCIAIIKDGVCTLWTRTQKPITGVPHIVAALNGWPDCVLDGELYNHDYRDNFEDLTSFIRQVTPKDGHEVIEYHIYDVVSDDPFKIRNEDRFALGNGNGSYDKPLVYVETHYLMDEEDFMPWFERFISLGYEGMMVRNQNGLYVNKRSYDLQKVKEFEDAEFEVVGVEEGRGRMAGKAMFVCDVGGETFKVKMKGSLDSLAAYLAYPDKWIGRDLTVQFQGLTKNGIPRFPIGLRFREDV
jgi:DNA ligase-1